jgi:hypothetical protein
VIHYHLILVSRRVVNDFVRKELKILGMIDGSFK